MNEKKHKSNCAFLMTISTKKEDKMRFNIYQIDMDLDNANQKFRSFNNQKIDPAIYKKVFSGCINELNTLEDVYTKFNIDIPRSHYGHSLSVSDIIEVLDSSTVKNGFYHCDSVGFKQLSDFNKSLCIEFGDTYRVIAVEPNKPAYETEIKNDLTSLQTMVGGGLIENMYNQDGTIFVVNDEGKINGMQANRRVENDIIAGPFFVIRDDGENYASLNDNDIDKYMKMFEYPDTDITQEEIDSLIKCDVFSFDNADDFWNFLEGMSQ